MNSFKSIKRSNIIYVSAIIISIIAFLFGISISKIENTNTNTNIINIREKSDKQKTNINTADKSELMSIDGIGDKKANYIIANRPYSSIWDLEKAHISEEFIKKIQDNITT